MINDLLILAILFGLVFFFIDLLLIAASSGLANINRAHLLALNDEYQQATKNILTICDSAKRLLAAETSMRFTRKLILLLLIGIFLILIYWLSPENERPISLQIHWNLYLILWAVGLFIINLIITLIEVMVAQIAANNAEQVTVRLINLIHFLESSTAPLIGFPLSLLPKKIFAMNTPSLVTEDELKSMVDASEQGGLLEQDEKKMIYSIFDLGDTIVREIMIPRVDVFALDVETNIQTAVEAMISSGYSRVPVFENTIDQIIGLIYAKDILKAVIQPQSQYNLRDLLRPAYFIPEAKKINDLLTEMQTKHVHMAIAIDEYGGVAGLVTLEDIIEEIFGDIRDEYDEGEELYYQQLGDDDYLCSARMDIDDVNELFNANLSSEEADTLAGLVYHLFGRVPKEGESIEIDGLLLTVAQVTYIKSRGRIRKVRVQRSQ